MGKRRSRRSFKRKQVNEPSKGFFAYPSNPKDRADIIESGIRVINKRTDQYQITSWRFMPKHSSRIISNILDAILQSDFVISDISGLNSNVLFEAGYAFGLEKKGLLVSQLNSSTERVRDINDLYILRGWDIGSYRNAQDLSDSVLSSHIMGNTSRPEIKTYVGRERLTPRADRALFLRGICHHEVAIRAHR